MAEATQTVAPATEPVTLDECKSQLRLEIPDDDVDVLKYVAVARKYAQNFNGQQFVTATYAWRRDYFESVFYPPHPPLQSVTSITYLDTAGDSQTLAASVYQVDIHSKPARIMVAQGQSWPATQSGTFNAVTITYVAGYGAQGVVPEEYKQAIRLMVAHMYEHREPVVSYMSRELAMTVHDLLWMDRVKAF